MAKRDDPSQIDRSTYCKLPQSQRIYRINRIVSNIPVQIDPATLPHWVSGEPATEIGVVSAIERQVNPAGLMPVEAVNPKSASRSPETLVLRP